MTQFSRSDSATHGAVCHIYVTVAPNWHDTRRTLSLWYQRTNTAGGIRTHPRMYGGKASFSTGGAKSGAVGAQNAPNDTDLAGWLDACQIPLDDTQRDAVRRIVRQDRGDRLIGRKTV